MSFDVTSLQKNEWYVMYFRHGSTVRLRRAKYLRVGVDGTYHFWVPVGSEGVEVNPSAKDTALLVAKVDELPVVFSEYLAELKLTPLDEITWEKLKEEYADTTALSPSGAQKNFRLRIFGASLRDYCGNKTWHVAALFMGELVQVPIKGDPRGGRLFATFMCYIVPEQSVDVYLDEH